jgi:hypothetical protein
VDCAQLAFVARCNPWRLAEISLDAPGAGLTPDVAAWADDATAILRGSPPAQHVVGDDETWGDFALRDLLEPETLQTIAPKPWEGRFTIDGKDLGPDSRIALQLVSIGCERYEVEYDASLDVITAWTAIIDGQPAQRIQLSHLTALAS